VTVVPYAVGDGREILRKEPSNNQYSVYRKGGKQIKTKAFSNLK
jgi:hypothetical protein